MLNDVAFDATIYVIFGGNSIDMGILDIVKNLESSLTSVDPNVRASAIDKLTDAIGHKQTFQPLSSMEVSTINEFLCAKLSDNHMVSSKAIVGLQSLVMTSSLQNADVRLSLQSLFNEIQVQTLPQKDRLAVLSILRRLLLSNLKACQEMKHDFVFGFIQCIDGEKDPRNLLLVFELFLCVVQNFDISRFQEDMFEVVACYFPIDFSPSSRDPGSVSRDELVELNSRCLASSPLFGEFLIPLVIEKMSSDLRMSRIDSFKLLASCVSSYSKDQLLSHHHHLFDCFKRSLFRSAVTAEEREAALQSFNSFSAAIVASCNNSEVEEFFELVLKECRPNFRELDDKVMKVTGDVLRLSASSSTFMCHYILDGTLSEILLTISSRKDPGSQLALLYILENLLSSVKLFWEHPSVSECLHSKKDNLFLLLHSLAIGSHVDLKCKAIQILTELLTLPNLLDEKSSNDVVSYVLQILTCATSRETDACVYECAIQCLFKYLESKEDLVVLNELLESAKESNLPSHRHVCLLLSNCVSLPFYCRKLISHFFSVFSSEESVSCLGNFVFAFSQNVSKWMNSTAESKDVLIRTFSENIDMYIARFSEFSHSIHSVMFDNAVTALDIFCGCLDKEWDTEFCRQVEDCSNILVHSSSFGVLRFRAVILINLPPQFCNRVATNILDLCANQICCCVDSCVKLCVQLYASFLNKVYNLRLESASVAYKDQLKSHVDSIRSRTIMCNDEAMSWRFAYFVLWVTKACFVGAVSFSQFLLDSHVLEILFNPKYPRQIRVQIAENINVLVDSCDDVFTKNHKAFISPVYIQKTVLLCLPRLLEACKTTNSDVKHAVLEALINFTQHSPPEFMGDFMESVVNFAVKSLLQAVPSSPPDSAKIQSFCEALICLLESIVKGRPDVLTSYLQDLIPFLISQLQQRNASLNGQMSQLRLLGCFTRLPVHVVLPYRRDILRGLVASLDSSKRVVRGQAAIVRNQWFLIGAAEA